MVGVSGLRTKERPFFSKKGTFPHDTDREVGQACPHAGPAMEAWTSAREPFWGLVLQTLNPKHPQPTLRLGSRADLLLLTNSENVGSLLGPASRLSA